MSDWEEKPSAYQLATITDRRTGKEVAVLLHLGHNADYADYFCQVEFEHFYNETETVELARIDSSHGQLHIDHLWKEEVDKEIIHEGLDMWDAAKKLQENWPSYYQKWSNREDTDSPDFVEISEK